MTNSKQNEYQPVTLSLFLRERKGVVAVFVSMLVFGVALAIRNVDSDSPSRYAVANAKLKESSHAPEPNLRNPIANRYEVVSLGPTAFQNFHEFAIALTELKNELAPTSTARRTHIWGFERVLERAKKRDADIPSSIEFVPVVEQILAALNSTDLTDQESIAEATEIAVRTWETNQLSDLLTFELVPEKRQQQDMDLAIATMQEFTDHVTRNMPKIDSGNLAACHKFNETACELSRRTVYILLPMRGFLDQMNEQQKLIYEKMLAALAEEKAFAEAYAEFDKSPDQHVSKVVRTIQRRIDLFTYSIDGWNASRLAMVVNSAVVN